MYIRINQFLTEKQMSIERYLHNLTVLIGALFRTWMNMNRNLLLLGRFFTANCQFNYTGSLFIENHGPMNTNQIDVVIMWAIIPLLLFKVIHRIRLLDLLSTKESRHSRSEV